MLTIHIVGGGAVGLLLASYVAQWSVYPVALVTRTEEQAEALRHHGLKRIHADGTEQVVYVQASTVLQVVEGDLVIIAVKYSDVAAVVTRLASYNKIAVLFIQNGLAHLSMAQSLLAEEVLVGSAQFGATKVDATTVSHKGVGPLKLASVKGSEQWLYRLLEQKDTQLPISFQADASFMLLEKALLNCFINPLTAILQISNGELLTNAHAYTLLQQLYNELMAAFPTMQPYFPFESVKLLCERTAYNTSSMLADRLAKRPMEIETIVGAVLNKAAVPVPTLQTLYMLLLAINEQKGA